MSFGWMEDIALERQRAETLEEEAERLWRAKRYDLAAEVREEAAEARRFANELADWDDDERSAQ